ncbi:MAG: T9SS type A sorting domain-containing protein [bacterium]
MKRRKEPQTIGATQPQSYSLSQNYPNPFNPETTIKYQLLKVSQVKLEIFNLVGQRVTPLVDKEQLAGFYSVQWNGKDRSGRSVASGIYLYQLKAEDFVKVRKLTLLR